MTIKMLQNFFKISDQKSDGRYEIEFPFKKENPKISDNFAPCIERLQSIWSKGNKEKLLEK